MILEYADGGNLNAYLKKHFTSLTWKEKYNLGLSITSGLGYLHSLDIIHKDLVCICSFLSYIPINHVYVQLQLF